MSCLDRELWDQVETFNFAIFHLNKNSAFYCFADLIESASQLASGNADVIKTHHNDTELVRKLRAQKRVVEPLKEFHKDEVSAFR